MPSLSLDESRRRADQLSVESYDVSLDLSGDDRTFTSISKVRFSACGAADTFVEVQPVRLRDASLVGPVDEGVGLERGA